VSARALFLAAATTVAGAAGVTPAVGGASVPLPRCSAPAHNVRQTEDLRLFRVRGRVYTCWRPTRRVTLVAHVGVFEGGSLSVEIDPDVRPRVKGRFVGFMLRLVGEPDEYHVRLFSVDARAGRILYRVRPKPASPADDNTQVNAFVIADNGALAYVQDLFGGGGRCPKADGAKSGVIAVDASGSRALDCETGAEGPTDRISALRAHGHVVTWMHFGMTQTATLG
jgi:hypothetical protein